MSTVNIFDMVDTWNAGGTTFTAIKMNVTDTASAADSLLLDLQVGGASQFSVSKAGNVKALASDIWLYASGSGTALIRAGSNSSRSIQFGGSSAGGTGLGAITNGGLFSAITTGGFAWVSATNPVGTVDLALMRDAANTLAQRNGANAQAFRVYNTFTDSSNNERGILSWSSNQLFVGTEQVGTGSPRNLVLYTAGAASIRFYANGYRWSMSGSGHFLAETDNSFDIGASGANRPRDLFIAGDATIGNNILVAGAVQAGQAQNFQWNGRSRLSSPANGNIRLTNATAADFGLLMFGGTTSSFPALKRSTTELHARLADDSAFAAIKGKLTTDTDYTAGDPVTTGYLTLYDAAGVAYKVPALAA